MKQSARAFVCLASLMFLMTWAGRAAGAFAPTDVSGLRFWFSPATLDASASYSDGDPVGLWKTTGGDINRDASASGSARPTYVSAASGINNHPVARFDGAANWMQVVSTGLDASGPDAGPSLFAVFRTTSTDATRGYDGNAAQNLLGDRSNNVVWGLGVTGGAGEYNAYNGATPGGWIHADGTSTVNAGSPHLISIVRSGSTARFYTDWRLENTANVGVDFLSLTSFNTIGAGYLNGSGVQDFFTGDIAEIIIYNRALTPSETSDVNNYLLEEFAIPEPAAAMLGLVAITPIAIRRRRSS